VLQVVLRAAAQTCDNTDTDDLFIKKFKRSTSRTRELKSYAKPSAPLWATHEIDLFPKRKTSGPESNLVIKQTCQTKPLHKSGGTPTAIKLEMEMQTMGAFQWMGFNIRAGKT